MDFDFQKLKQHWPSAIVARSEDSRFSGGLLHPRTLANQDSAGDGPKNRIQVGRKIAYPVDSLIEWLEERAEVA